MTINRANNRSLLQKSDWPVKDLPGLSLEEQAQLKNCGINTTEELITRGKTPEERIILAGKLQVDLHSVNKWVVLAGLARVPSVGTQYCGMLLHAGVISIAQLAQTPTHRLHRQVMRLQVSTLHSRDLCPAVELVQQWSHEAQAMGN
ncbi:DUF4332 domain-containing protein [Dolichospermum circinale]|uniref:DUF4332 domain-containing protein n=1 Tax=Dolichospermum circinale TaxID=109265 RepID=UPI0004030D34|nr:DUF4332 domain-containing protein [Dolichospermum circinale]MDB9481665.1 DUF4332 domain-containing protein [Dolichospermum circinale CS-537/05]MDB9454390.1 DUF4332 domain-containing protein [Dolichospermum circinale CS-541/06]MDB9463684.1 DUF4332 domain-containing protein [Dolichospermum circinale CS-541/04]MDB9475624.1 DUF4332 domain-containing protein [Dolichospermum circinale CS-537/11]MDB9477562.1 DUF4332 domain-containing protein [Dolichospermum circinale CS-537/03]